MPFSLAKYLLKVSCEYDMSLMKKNIMINFIIDTAGEKIFLKIISDDTEYINNNNNCRENFDELVKIMVDYDLNQAKKEATLLKENLISPTWEHPVHK